MTAGLRCRFRHAQAIGAMKKGLMGLDHLRYYLLFPVDGNSR